MKRKETVNYYIISSRSPSPRPASGLYGRPCPHPHSSLTWPPSSSNTTLSANPHHYQNAGARRPQTRAATLRPSPPASTETVQRRKRPTAPVLTAKRPISPATTVRPSPPPLAFTDTASTARPCQRCIKRGMAGSCVEGHRKKAKYLLDDDELGPSPSTSPFVCLPLITCSRTSQVVKVLRAGKHFT